MPSSSAEGDVSMDDVWAEIDVALSTLYQVYEQFSHITLNDFPARSLEHKAKVLRSLTRQITGLADREPSGHQFPPMLAPTDSKTKPYMFGYDKLQLSTNESFIEGVLQRLVHHTFCNELTSARFVEILHEANDLDTLDKLDSLFDRRNIYGFEAEDLKPYFSVDKGIDGDDDTQSSSRMGPVVAAMEKSVLEYTNHIYQQQVGKLRTAGIEVEDLRMLYERSFKLESEDQMEMFILGMGELRSSGMARVKKRIDQIKDAVSTGCSDATVATQDHLTKEEWNAVYKLYKRRTGSSIAYGEFVSIAMQTAAIDEDALAEWKRKAGYELYGGLTNVEMKEMIRAMHSRYEHLLGRKITPPQFEQVARSWLEGLEGGDAMLQYTGLIRAGNMAKQHVISLKNTKLDDFLKRKSAEDKVSRVLTAEETELVRARFQRERGITVTPKAALQMIQSHLQRDPKNGVANVKMIATMEAAEQRDQLDESKNAESTKKKQKRRF